MNQYSSVWLTAFILVVTESAVVSRTKLCEEDFGVTRHDALVAD